MIRHENKPICLKCQEKLDQAHSYLVRWFLNIKRIHIDAHVCWSYRDKKTQNEAFYNNKSQLKYPNSKHNAVDENGKPCSQALDLFRLTENGKALFEESFYKQIYEETKEMGYLIFWGGNFKSFKDSDHFEMKS